MLTAQAQLDVLFHWPRSHEQLATVIQYGPLTTPLVHHQLTMPRDSVLQRSAHVSAACSQPSGICATRAETALTTSTMQSDQGQPSWKLRLCACALYGQGLNTPPDCGACS